MSAATGAIPLLVIAGPTATGKTAMALRICELLGGEIVSADSMQIYRQMDIGTAKPTADERARAAIHLIDCVPPDGRYTVADFCARAAPLIADIHARGCLPVLCGGTGLYVRALTEGFEFPPGGSDDAVRAELWAEAEELGGAVLHRRLAQVDPVAAAGIEPGDTRRIVRALEVHRLTGEPISAARGRRQPVDADGAAGYNCAKYVLTAPRQLLFDRIERRVDRMMAAGWLDEVRALVAQGVTAQAQSMQAIGYRRLLQHLAGECDLHETVRLIKRDTRRYAKRQMTWLRGGEGYRWLAIGNERQQRACTGTIARAAQQLSRARD